MIFPDIHTTKAYIGDVLVGLLGSTDLMSLSVHVDLSLVLLIDFSVLQLQDEKKKTKKHLKNVLHKGIFEKKSAGSQRGTYTAGDVFDPLHVLLVWGIVRQGVRLSFGLIVLHLVDDLRIHHCHIVRRISKDTKIFFCLGYSA